jgi:predicted nucleotidyltransferase
MEPLPDLAPQVHKGLDAFVEAARSAFGADLVSIVLYGSAAEGRLRTASDVNTIVVLKQFDRARVDAVREAYRSGRVLFRLTAMFLLESEIDAAFEAFAVKFSDILTRHRVLYGTDPLEKHVVSREATLSRLKQVLLNLELRLRERYALVSLRDEQFVPVLAEAAAPLRACAYSLLQLEGRKPASPREALLETVRDLDGPRWQDLVDGITQARQQGDLPPGLGGNLVFEVLELIRRLRDRLARVHQLGEVNHVQSA